MSLTEKYKWKIAPLIHNFKSVAENIINEIWSSRQTIVLLKRNPAKMKTCKGYGFKIWTKKHVKGNQEIERDRLKILSKRSDTRKTICKKSLSVKYLWRPFPAALQKLITGKLSSFWYVMQGLNLRTMYLHEQRECHPFFIIKICFLIDVSILV